MAEHLKPPKKTPQKKGDTTYIKRKSQGKNRDGKCTKLKAGWIKLGFMPKRTRGICNAPLFHFVFVLFFSWAPKLLEPPPNVFFFLYHFHLYTLHLVAPCRGRADKNVETITKVIPRRHCMDAGI